MLRVAYGSASWLTTPLGLAILMLALGMTPSLGAPWLMQLSLVPFFLFLSFWFFYRDPERRVGDGVVSPADGKVVRIDVVDDPELGRCDRLAVFMSPLVVHVNRFPVAGDIRSVTHHAGKHLPAFSKDSDRNERVVTRMKSVEGEWKVVQIAGAVARRIVPYAKAGDAVKRGERLGLIRLGSRCDIIVPVGRVQWTVQVGQRVLAAATQVGRIGPAPARADATHGQASEQPSGGALSRPIPTTSSPGNEPAHEPTVETRRPDDTPAREGTRRREVRP